MKRPAILAALLVASAVAAGLYLTRPQSIDVAKFAGLTPNIERGEWVFHAAGCASCHKGPGVDEIDTLVLAGGKEFVTDFGTFTAPNISSDETHGIGGWSDIEILTALTKGTSPGGQHYYPAFPYNAYAKADPEDMLSLVAYLRTLPADSTPSQPHRLGFPFSIRAGVGLWKLLYFNENWAIDVGDDPTLQKGQYIAEALAHCGECHTPRSGLGGLDTVRWLDGAPNPSGDGRIPGISHARLGWSIDEISAYLTDGFTPDFDVAGGSMRAVVNAMAKLDAEDRTAIAAYVASISGTPE